MKSICPLCNHPDLCRSPQTSTDYISNQSFELLKCDHCQCYMTDTTELGQAEQYYGPGYYNSAKGKFSVLFEKIFSWNHKRNAQKLHRFFQPKTILEIGCGRAYLLTELKKLGSEVYCLESAEAAEWILQNQEVNISALPSEQSGDWPFQTEFFDLIILWHVLEHLEDPVSSLKETARTLKTGKYLCISVPDISSLQARINRTTWFHLDVPRHLFHFSRSGLIDLLEQNGFKIIKVVPGDTIQNLYGWWQSLANLFTPSKLNSIYRLLQGGFAIQEVSKKSLLIQLSTAPLWFPLGLVGYFAERITGSPGNITVIARKV